MIELKNVSYKYEDKYVLGNINLNIHEGTYIAILGRNGSGKSTLIKHLNSLLLPNKGSVIVDGIDTKKTPIEVRKLVGILFQNPEDQLINSIVEEDIAFGLENLNVKREEMIKRVEEILKKLNIKHLSKTNVNILSLGQKQLVALAGILVMKPKYLVFDEPTTFLDMNNKKNILSIIRDLNKKDNLTIIHATNVIEDIKNAERIVMLSEGKVVLNCNKDKIKIGRLKSFLA